jgi:hypothetical protein
MMKSPKDKAQIKAFVDGARSLECDEFEERFDAAPLRKSQLTSRGRKGLTTSKRRKTSQIGEFTISGVRVEMKNIGRELQNWCRREAVNVDSDIFPAAVNLAAQNSVLLRSKQSAYQKVGDNTLISVLVENGLGQSLLIKF